MHCNSADSFGLQMMCGAYNLVAFNISEGSMNSSSLKEILYRQTDAYLEKDNPLAKTNKEKLIGFFSCHGLKGRNRAIDYRTDVIFAYHDDSLLQQVFDDIKGIEKPIGYKMAKRLNLVPGAIQIKRLGTSKQFRSRLLEGLSIYLGLEDEAYKRERSFSEAAISNMSMNAGMPLAYMPIVIDMDDIRELLVSEKIDAMNTENKTFTYCYTPGGL